MKPDDMISFWCAAGESRWFFKDAAFDGALAVRFGAELNKARNGDYDHWAETPEGALGLILLLDQVSRNIHRGSPLSFAADARALRHARAAVAKGFHLSLPAPKAMWLFMPFEHAEDIDAQERCVSLFTTTGMTDKIHYAKIHRDIIARFGRFPHRNKVLGRSSTPDELAFLAAGGFAG